jgi:hypothetical protein
MAIETRTAAQQTAPRLLPAEAIEVIWSQFSDRLYELGTDHESPDAEGYVNGVVKEFVYGKLQEQQAALGSLARGVGEAWAEHLRQERQRVLAQLVEDRPEHALPPESEALAALHLVNVLAAIDEVSDWLEAEECADAEFAAELADAEQA